MADLSIIQEYLICAVNKKGMISGFTSIEKSVGFVAAGLLEMQLDKYILIDKKNVTVIAELPTSKLYLKSLYDFINKPKPVKIQKIVESYLCTLSNKKVNELFDSVGNTLVDLEIAKTETIGLLGEKKGYIPQKKFIYSVIDKVRAELLENGEITDDVAALVILLEKSKILNTYFSKFEQKEIKSRILEIINSPTYKTVCDMNEYVENMISTMTAMVVAIS